MISTLILAAALTQCANGQCAAPAAYRPVFIAPTRPSVGVQVTVAPHAYPPAPTVRVHVATQERPRLRLFRRFPRHR